METYDVYGCTEHTVIMTTGCRKGYWELWTIVSLPAVKMTVAPPSHTFLSLTGRLSPWQLSFLALWGDNKVEMCLKWEGGRWKWAHRGRERDKLKMLLRKYFKPRRASDWTKEGKHGSKNAHTDNSTLVDLWGPYIAKKPYPNFHSHLRMPSLNPPITKSWL